MGQAGRPKELKHPVSTDFQLEEEELTEFKMVALRQGKPMAKLLREFIKDYINNHQENDQGKLDASIEDPSHLYMPTMGEVLTLDRLYKLSDDDLELLGKAILGRWMEIFQEMNRRDWIVDRGFGRFERPRRK